MLAVFVNCLTVIFGSIIGLLFSKKFTEELLEMIQVACGVITLVLGFQMAFKFNSIVFLTLSLIIGAIIGYAINIDRLILKLGEKLEKLTKLKSSKKIKTKSQTFENEDKDDKNEIQVKSKIDEKNNNFAFAFLNSSVLFCVGAMAIVGSFQAGVEHNYTTIFTKSILDGFMAMSLTAASGIGTAFSSIIIFIYQGSLTLLSKLFQPFVTEILIQEITACGGAIIIMIGLNLLGLKRIKTANFLPSLVIQILFVIFVPLIKNLFVK